MLFFGVFFLDIFIKFFKVRIGGEMEWGQTCKQSAKLDMWQSEFNESLESRDLTQAIFKALTLFRVAIRVKRSVRFLPVTPCDCCNVGVCAF